VSGSSAKEVFSRDEACRYLHISERQLASWERQQLVPASQQLRFPDLLALKTLAELRRSRVAPATIKKAVVALRKTVGHVGDPLRELRIYAQGSKIRVDIDGQTMEPVSGQLLLDFGAEEIKTLLAFPRAEEGAGESSARRQKREFEAEALFEQALRMEQSAAPLADIIAIYERAIEVDPNSTGALVNLGTLYFNARRYNDAERYYKRALEVDPEYALAHFNLGNLYDERGDRARAMQHYLEALRSNPSYADAHYNVALLYQNSGQKMKAARHWREYLKTDPGSSWAAVARRELEKIKSDTIVQGGGE
jgi:tetratricopeptide (TPR) repeat protein